MSQKPIQFPIKFEQYFPYLALTAISAIIFLISSVTSTVIFDLLSFDRTAIGNGQWWRLLTGHLLHTNFIHFAVNILGLFLLWLLHGDYANIKTFSWQFLFLSIGISTCIWFLTPNIQWYVGLSGVLHGFFVWGAMVDIHLKRKSGYLLLIGIVIKLIDEQFFADQSFMSSLIDANVAIDAHLYGAMLGLLIGAFTIYKK